MTPGILPLPRFVSFGEALTDLIRVGTDQWTSKNGGSPWNVARAVAACGIPSAFAGAISRCCFGDALWQASAEGMLDLRFLQRVERSPLLAVVHEASPPRYFFVGDDSADLHFDPDALPAGWADHAERIHFGSLALARRPLAGRLVALAGALHAAGRRISFDPNVRNLMDAGYLPTFEHLCRLADIIKISDEDARALYPDRSPAATVAAIRAWNPAAWWLYTEGERGAKLLTPEGTWQALPPPISLVDTVGAGDACIGGLLASQLNHPGANPASHLAFAIAAGAAACETTGASPPAPARIGELASWVKVRRN